MKKKIFTIINYENDNIKNSDDEWERISNTRMGGRFEKDKLYINISKQKNSNDRKTMRIYIGNEICDCLSLKERDRVSLLTSKSNPYVMKIKKSKEAYDHLLRRSPEQITTLSTSVTLHGQLNKLTDTKSRETIFDFLDDNALVINLSDLRE